MARLLEQFQQKCAAVLRPELRKNKEVKRFRDSKKSANALMCRLVKKKHPDIAVRVFRVSA